MIELDFEVQLEDVNKVMDVALLRGLTFRWVMYNKARKSASVRLLTPESELESVLFLLARYLGKSLEVSIVPSSRMELVGQAFLASIELRDKSYPIVLLMRYSAIDGPNLPSEVTVIAGKEFPAEEVASALGSFLNSMGFRRAYKPGRITRDGMTRVVMVSSE